MVDITLPTPASIEHLITRLRDWLVDLPASYDQAVRNGLAQAWTPIPADYDKSIHSNRDASAWAKFFVEVHPAFSAQESVMLGWFANAMMAMHDVLKREHREETDILRRDLDDANKNVVVCKSVIAQATTALRPLGLTGMTSIGEFAEALRLRLTPAIPDPRPSPALEHAVDRYVHANDDIQRKLLQAERERATSNAALAVVIASRDELLKRLEAAESQTSRADRALERLREEITASFKKHGLDPGPGCVDRLVEDRNRLTKERDRLVEDCDRLTKERDAARAERDKAVQSSASSVEAKVDPVVADLCREIIELRHAVNAWADVATNGPVILRNVRDGITHSYTALTDMQRGIDRVRSISSAIKPSQDLPGGSDSAAHSEGEAP